jgi:hypothetical protein
MGTRDFFHWGKAADNEADLSNPGSAEVKNVWSFISTALYIIMVKCFYARTFLQVVTLSFCI